MKPGLKLIKNTYGRGVVGAIRTGFDAAPPGPVLVVMADLSDDLGQVRRMLELYRQGSHIVVGSRYMKGGRLIGGPWFKQLLSRLSGLTLCWFRGIPTHDATNAFKIYDRAMLGDIQIESKGGFELSLEITVKAFLAGYTISETPSTWRDRTAGHLALQALEVAAALPEVVFHGLPAEIAESPRQGGTSAYVNAASATLSIGNTSDRQKMSRGEVLLLCCSVASLIISCFIWSARKQAWMDEIFTWKEASDRSLWHLYWAIQHGADGGQPLFYTTAWLWVKAFGASVLSLRLYSCAAMCGALLVTWRCIRRVYGLWATAFGVLWMWGSADLLLDQNAEGRFYGLYMLAVAVAVDVYLRLAARATPTRLLLLYSLFAQAALVLTHVLGLFYSGMILLALVLFDALDGRFRIKVYLFHAAGWLALLVWAPAIRASMAAGKPHGWIPVPNLSRFFDTYLLLGLPSVAIADTAPCSGLVISNLPSRRSDGDRASDSNSAVFDGKKAP